MKVLTPGLSSSIGTETIGVISDTHGLVRPEALEALRGCRRLIHAGDVGSPDVLAQLGEIAPVVAVRGNVDHGRWATSLPESLIVDVDGHAVYVIHILSDAAPPADVAAVIYGHSHTPAIEDRSGVLYLNPGSAGPRRFKLPVSVARLSVVDGQVTAEIVELKVG
jgi:uncharacterized protein